MAKDRIFFLLTFGLLGLLAAFLFRDSDTSNVSLPERTQIENAGKIEKQQKKVLYAQKKLIIGDRLDKHSYVWKEINEEEITPTLIVEGQVEENWLTDAIISKNVEEGEMIKRLDVLWPGEIGQAPSVPLAPGKIAVPYDLSKLIGMTDFLEAGKLTDVIFTAKPELGLGSMSVTLLNNIRILATIKPEREAGASHNNDTYILLEMTPRQAEIFSYAQQAGFLMLGLTREEDKEFYDYFSENSVSEELLNCQSAGNFNSTLVTYLIQSLFPSANVKVESTTKGFIVSGAVAEPQIAGQIVEVLNKVAPGGHEAVVNLIETTSIPLSAGNIAVPFTFKCQSGIAQFMDSGNFVDVVFNAKPDLGFGSFSVTLLRSLRILANAKTNSFDKEKEEGVNILLEMSPRQAEIFSYAQQAGTLSLGLSDEGERVAMGEDDLADKLISSRSVGNFNSTLVSHLIKSLFPHVDVRVDATTKGFIASGKVADPQVADKIIEILNKVAEGGKESVVNLMEVVPQQVMISVKVLEVSTDYKCELGLNWASIFDDGQTQFAVGTTFPRPEITDPNYFLEFIGRPGNWTLSAFIDLLQQRGLGEVLAEPNLTTISGEPAEFFAGGEFPILVPQGGTLAGTVTVIYKKFGVILNFTPFVDLNGLITLDIVPEVSRIDEQNSVVLQGFTIPALTTRRANTTVKLWPGQSYAIAGLIQNETITRTFGICGLERLPIIGPLFRQKQHENIQTEIMIIITPYLINSDKVSPLEPCQADPCATECCPEPFLDECEPQQHPRPNLHRRSMKRKPFPSRRPPGQLTKKRSTKKRQRAI